MLGLLKIRLSDFCNIIFSTAANGKVSAVSAWPLAVSLWQNNMICLISTAYKAFQAKTGETVCDQALN
jgi:hypothetical protein